MNTQNVFFKVKSSNNECKENILSFVEYPCLRPTWRVDEQKFARVSIQPFIKNRGKTKSIDS